MNSIQLMKLFPRPTKPTTQLRRNGPSEAERVNEPMCKSQLTRMSHGRLGFYQHDESVVGFGVYRPHHLRRRPHTSTVESRPSYIKNKRKRMEKKRKHWPSFHFLQVVLGLVLTLFLFYHFPSSSHPCD